PAFPSSAPGACRTHILGSATRPGSQSRVLGGSLHPIGRGGVVYGVTGRSACAEFFCFGRGKSARDCLSPEPRSGEVAFARRPAGTEKFGECRVAGPHGAARYPVHRPAPVIRKMKSSERLKTPPFRAPTSLRENLAEKTQ